MKKIILIFFITFSLTNWKTLIFAHDYPKESLIELQAQTKEAANRGENIDKYVKQIQLKLIQRAPVVSILIPEDVIADMKLLKDGKKYLNGLLNCGKYLFKTPQCSYPTLYNNYKMHRCLEQKSKTGKLIRLGYCSDIVNGPFISGERVEAKASKSDMRLWDIIDNSVNIITTKQKETEKLLNLKAQKIVKKVQLKEPLYNIGKHLQKLYPLPYETVWDSDCISEENCEVTFTAKKSKNEPIKYSFDVNTETGKVTATNFNDITTELLKKVKGYLSLEMSFNDFPYPWYINKIRDILVNSFKTNNFDWENKQRVSVSFQIQHDGSITNLEVIDPLADNALREKIIRIIKENSPYPELPEGKEYVCAKLEINK